MWRATEELKLDSYRAIAIRIDRMVQLRSRNDNDSAQQLPAHHHRIDRDGELVALDASGRPSPNHSV